MLGKAEVRRLACISLLMRYFRSLHLSRSARQAVLVLSRAEIVSVLATVLRRFVIGTINKFKCVFVRKGSNWVTSRAVGRPPYFLAADIDVNDPDLIAAGQWGEMKTIGYKRSDAIACLCEAATPAPTRSPTPSPTTSPTPYPVQFSLVAKMHIHGMAFFTERKKVVWTVAMKATLKNSAAPGVNVTIISSDSSGAGLSDSNGDTTLDFRITARTDLCAQHSKLCTTSSLAHTIQTHIFRRKLLLNLHFLTRYTSRKGCWGAVCAANQIQVHEVKVHTSKSSLESSKSTPHKTHKENAYSTTPHSKSPTAAPTSRIPLSAPHNPAITAAPLRTHVHRSPNATSTQIWMVVLVVLLNFVLVTINCRLALIVQKAAGLVEQHV